MPYLEKGYLQVYTSGANRGVVISAGMWYTTGTYATYTIATSGRSLYYLTLNFTSNYY